jgi:hypothetical protein
MKCFVNGFWPGFLDKTDANNYDFFKVLFAQVFNEDVEPCSNMGECDILLESVFSNDIKVFAKQWKCTFLFSGEQGLNPYSKHYNCVLWGHRNRDNIVNCPLFVVYLHCTNLMNGIKCPEQVTVVPSKKICAVISNSNAPLRNAILEKIEKRIPVDYYGRHKNNQPNIQFHYKSSEFRKVIGQYKFVLSLENSRVDTYVTEKITHGLLAGNVPIYWGAPRVGDYFNKERFIELRDTSDAAIDEAIDKLEHICNGGEEGDAEFLRIANQPALKDEISMEMIARDVRNLIFGRTFPTIDQIFLINSPAFEPERHQHLCNLFFNKLKVSPDNVTFICPTFKHTITDEMMREMVKDNSVLMLRTNGPPMRKSEISLICNFKATLEHIEKRYAGGNFLIFESDIIPVENIALLPDFLQKMKAAGSQWDFVHIGQGHPNYDDVVFGAPYAQLNGPMSKCPQEFYEIKEYREDITNEKDQVRMVRKYYPRCTDSFLWNYSGVTKCLDFFNTHPNYFVPLDNYMANMLELTPDIKHYWSSKFFFVQGSHYGKFASNIQQDDYCDA